MKTLQRYPILLCIALGFTWLVSGTLTACAEIPKEKLYAWQTSQYKETLKAFPQLFAKNSKPKVPNLDPDSLYQWQMDTYQGIKKIYPRQITENIASRPLPKNSNDIYHWQIEIYRKTLDAFPALH